MVRRDTANAGPQGVRRDNTLKNSQRKGGGKGNQQQQHGGGKGAKGNQQQYKGSGKGAEVNQHKQQKPWQRQSQQPQQHQEYERVHGTKIQTLKGGKVVRVVIESGKSYAPNDLNGVYRHLDQLEGAAHPSNGGGKGGKGGKVGKGGNASWMAIGNGQQQYEKIPGTKIQHLKGGEVVRVVNADGKQFPVNDLHTVCIYLDKIQGGGGGQAKGGRKNGGGKGKHRNGMREQFEQIRGTSIAHTQDGEAVRVVSESGKTFWPDDVDACYKHLDNLARKASTKGKGGGKNQGGGNNQGGGQYEKIKGTQIRTTEDGKVVRYVPASEKIFPVNDVATVYHHLEKLAATQQGGNQGKNSKGRGKGGSKGGAVLMALPGNINKVKKKGLKQKGEARPEGKTRFADRVAQKKRGQQGSAKKERTQDEIDAFKEKNAAKSAERHKVRTERDGRSILSNDWYEGEFIQKMQTAAWIKPTGSLALPADAETKRKEMIDPKKMKGNAKDCTDLLFMYYADLSGHVKVGEKVKFQVYEDKKRVGACSVEPA